MGAQSEKDILDKDLDKLGLMEIATRFVLQKAAAPGLALVFLMACGFFASFAITSSTAMALIVPAAVLAAYMALNIGANDVTNNVGAAVGANAISLSAALLLAAFCEIAGAVLAGGEVVATVKNEIVSPVLVNDADRTITVMMSALLAAALWINIATWINAPVSTTHSIIGAIMGAGVVVAGTATIDWPTIASITISWFASPLMGGGIAAGFLWIITETIQNREQKVDAARSWVPVLLATMAGAFLTYILLVTVRQPDGFGFRHAALAGLFFGGLSYFWFRDTVARQAKGLENRNSSLKVLFRVPLIFAAALLSFAHGANDVSNAIGPLAAIVDASGVQAASTSGATPTWVMLIGAFGISVGLMLFGPRLIRIVGSQITKLNPMRAYCVAMSAAITVIIASAFGLPVSSTHVVVGAVFGVGFFREWQSARLARERSAALAIAGLHKAPAPDDKGSADQVAPHRYRYLVRRNHLINILAAWVVTLPLSALLSAAIAFIAVHVSA